MKLTASVILRNELHRYLEPCIAHLLEFVDEIVIRDNGSTDGWEETLRPSWGAAGARVIVTHDEDANREGGSLFVNHARSRQRLLDLTVSRGATHILACDADEFIDDGATLRKVCESSSGARYGALNVCLEEVWVAHEDRLAIRQDGGWNEHDVALLWRPDLVRRPHRIVDRGPATGRTPDTVARAPRGHACVSLLHFGWANRAEREDRYERYVVADGGRFHAGSHLASIMWPDERVLLRDRDWPAALEPVRAQILDYSTGIVA